MKNILFAAVLLCQQVYAQEPSTAAPNLVPNPGFEVYKKAPCGAMQEDITDYIRDWFSFGGTADIFYAPSITQTDCYASTQSTATNSPGTEVPHGGKGMAMVQTFNKTFSYREYFAVKLIKPLKKGCKYRVEFFVSLGDNCTIATNNLGLALTMDSKWLPKVGIVTTLDPVVNEAAVIEQKAGWQKISGSFVADSNYTHLLLGNFFSNQRTTMKKLDNGGSSNPVYNPAIYFVDDVSLVEDFSNGPSRVMLDELMGRKVVTKKTYEIDTEEVTISVYDAGREDGDSISVYVNGQCVRSKMALRREQTKIGTYKIEEGQSLQFFYYALNLGEIPPNTAQVILNSGGDKFEFKLDADMKTSDAIVIKRKKSAPSGG